MNKIFSSIKEYHQQANAMPIWKFGSSWLDDWFPKTNDHYKKIEAWLSCLHKDEKRKEIDVDKFDQFIKDEFIIIEQRP